MAQATHAVDFMCLQFCRPAQKAQNIAVIIVDYEDDILLSRFMDQWQGFNDVERAIISGLGETIHAAAAERGVAAVITYLQNTLSNTLRLSVAHCIVTSDLSATLQSLADTCLSHQQVPERSWLLSANRLRSSVSACRDTLARVIRPLLISLKSTRPSAATYATLSACSILLIVHTTVLLLETNTPRATRPMPYTPTITSVTRAASTPILAPIRDASSTQVIRQRTRPIAPVSRQPRVALHRQQFIAPQLQPVISTSRVQLLMAPDLSLAPAEDRTFELIPTASLVLPSPVPRVSGVRRLLQVMVYPFRKLVVDN